MKRSVNFSSGHSVAKDLFAVALAEAVKDRDHWQSIADRYRKALERIAVGEDGHEGDCANCSGTMDDHDEHCPTRIAAEALSPSRPSEEPRP